MRTARALTDHVLWCGGACMACMPPTTHAPHHACPPTHVPPAVHAPAMHPLPCTAPLPRMPPCHACPPLPHTPPATHAPCHTCPPVAVTRDIQNVPTQGCGRFGFYTIFLHYTYLDIFAFFKVLFFFRFRLRLSYCGEWGFDSEIFQSKRTNSQVCWRVW